MDTSPILHSSPKPSSQHRPGRWRTAVVTTVLLAATAGVVVGVVARTGPSTSPAATPATSPNPPDLVAMDTVVSTLPRADACTLMNAFDQRLADALYALADARARVIAAAVGSKTVAERCPGHLDQIALDRVLVSLPIADRLVVAAGLGDEARWDLAVRQFTANLGPYA